MPELDKFFAGQRGRRSCVVCERSSPLVSEILGLCPVCARTLGGLAQARDAHEKSRRRFALPEAPPATRGGLVCDECAARCFMGEGERGYCGLRVVKNGELVSIAGTPERGLLHWYRDPLPTHCVASRTCGGVETSGMHSLAVFYASCTLDCLFCQNWQFRDVDPQRSTGLSAEELAAQANARTHCVCFFGGDPASQMPHAIAAAEILAGRGVSVCWETAGTSNPILIDQAATLSLRSGGCIKFDIKAFSDPLHVCLTGLGNESTLDNFARLARRFSERRDPPLMVASTLLVPGYVDAQEVGRIAGFIAAQDPEIPYSLLAFSPAYLMSDLPRTSASHAEEARQAALDAGLKHVRIGNRHLLGAAQPVAG